MKATMKIEGMMCQHCVAHVTNALNAIDGVTANVVLDDNAAYLEISGKSFAEVKEQASQAVTDAGYTVVSCEEG